MIKYGVSQQEVVELIKLGVCHDEETARRLVASGEAGLLIKEARKSDKVEEAATEKSDK
tara:strand:- start:4906 stop:5082 length:177 start_codon:yes stop_codon:yes gene_type:complete